MPKIKIDHVVSFSSEDPVHVANNILDSDPSKKWKCKTPGEKSGIIVLQLEKAAVISSIDIGNENSAYIEVLVTRSGTNDDFKGFLVMSSFMSPVEARQSTNINKVRMFTQDDFSKPECEQKWDRVKIVCTQPFNRHVQYGLSFITLNTPGDKVNGQDTASTMGKFTLIKDSVDDLTPGSMFAKRKEIHDEPLKAAAAIRAATSSSSFTCSPKLKDSKATPKNNNNITVDSDDDSSKPLARNRNELLYNKEEEEPNEKIDKIIEKKKKETEEKEKQKVVTTPAKQQASKAKKETPSKIKPKKKDEESTNKRKNNSHTDSPSTSRKKTKTDNRPRKPFSQLLQGVTIVISGIQNPDRANLRTSALAMGAKYKPDWDNSCTHLICAFANTPKFQQVRGKGKIVKRGWIEDCHRERKRLPWRRYALDTNDQGKPESEDEIWEEVYQPTSGSPSPLQVTISDDELCDDDMQKRIKELQANGNQSSTSCTSNSNDLKTYIIDTDDEDEITVRSKEISKTLLDFFDKKRFHVDHLLDPEVYKTAERYIIAYNGIVMDCPGLDDVDVVIASEENVRNLKKLNENVPLVRPDWLWECHNNQTYLPIEPYKL